MTKRLDLGGTACYERPEDVIISIDGTTADDEVTPVVVADYNVAPFPSNTFDEAYGTCYFEGPYDLNELYRILKSGGRAIVTSCDVFKTEQERREAMQALRKEAKTAGFKVRIYASGLDFPSVRLYHP